MRSIRSRSCRPWPRRRPSACPISVIDAAHVRQGDGYFGWPDAAPFDAIVVTAAAPQIPPPLLEQLKPGGRMVIPVGAAFLVQQLMLIEKRADGTIRTEALLPVAFVPFTRAR